MISDILLAIAALAVTIGVIVYAWRSDDRTRDWTLPNLLSRLKRLIVKD